MKRLAPLFALTVLAACHKGGGPSVDKAWVKLPAVAGQPAAAYFTLHGGGKAARLVRIESALAGHAEMHESMIAGDTGNMKGMDMPGMPAMTTMKPINGIDVPAGGSVAFVPGGRHVMLSKLDPVVKPGTAIPLRFGFADGSTAEAEAKTVAAGDSAPY